MDEMAVKRTFLGKIQRNGRYCIIGALLLLVGIPLYQFIILVPAGYSNALATQALSCIGSAHTASHFSVIEFYYSQVLLS